MYGKVCLLVLISAFAVQSLTWKNCDRNAPAQVRSFKLSPDPIPLHKGAKITLSGSAELSGHPGVNYKLSLNIKKKLGWFYVRVPCIKNVGSCTYEISCQRIWEILQKQPAQCPVAQGLHSIPSTTVTLPDVSQLSLVPSGKYKVTANLFDKDSNKRVACVETMFSIA